MRISQRCFPQPLFCSESLRLRFMTAPAFDTTGGRLVDHNCRDARTNCGSAAGTRRRKHHTVLGAASSRLVICLPSFSKTLLELATRGSTIQLAPTWHRRSAFEYSSRLGSSDSSSFVVGAEADCGDSGPGGRVASEASASPLRRDRSYSVPFVRLHRSGNQRGGSPFDPQHLQISTA